MTSQEDIADQQALLATYRRTLHRALTQQALQGGEAFASPSVLATIDDARESISRIKAILRGWQVAVENHPDDEPPAPEPVPAAPPATGQDGWLLAHPYPMPPNFTGRADERQALSRWLDADAANRLLIVRALGGFGKSALAWHWLLNDVAAPAWPRVVWWSFEESSANFDVFLRHAVEYLTGAPRDLGPRQCADEVLRRLRQPGLLLVLDGFERELLAFSGMGAAYEEDRGARVGEPGTGDADAARGCVNPVAEHFLRSVCALPGIRGKVLITSRLQPQAVEVPGGALLQGCRTIELEQLRPEDALSFFRAEGVRGSEAEILQASQRYGYHPLSLRLLAGLVMSDLRTPGDIAAARRLDTGGDLIQRRQHVLEQAYTGLKPGRRGLLSRIACFRGPVSYEALASLGTGEGDLDEDLRDLLVRGLLHHDRSSQRYDLHAIVRQYAYDRMAGDERSTVHARLRDYFAALPPPKHVRTLDDIAPVVELYHHTVRVGRLDEAWQLYRDRLRTDLYYRLCDYATDVQLLEAVPRSSDGVPGTQGPEAQIWILLYSAMCYERLGLPGRAVEIAERAVRLSHRMPMEHHRGSAGVIYAMPSCEIGRLRQAESAIEEAVRIFDVLGDPNWRGISHRSCARVHMLRGDMARAEAELAAAAAAYDDRRTFLHGRSVLASIWAQSHLLHGEPARALAAAREALLLSAEGGYTRETVGAQWLLGAALIALRAEGGGPEGEKAEDYLAQAISSCRRLRMAEMEGPLLLDLARLAATAGDREEARRKAADALAVAERGGYVLQGADVNLFLARLAADEGLQEQARSYATEARRLATCDGYPDYSYRAAYDAAGALLAGL